MNRTHPALFPKGFKDAHKSHKLHKKYKLEIYEKVKQNKTKQVLNSHHKD